jgi:hypothetical protein
MHTLKWSALMFGATLAASTTSSSARADETGGGVSAQTSLNKGATAAAEQTPTAMPTPTPTSACPVSRPLILSNRWQENWSVLADPCVPREPFDSLKYMPLTADGDSYLSLGLNLRERFEENNAPTFGAGSQKGDAYLLDRLQVHADLHLGTHVQIFTQLEDVRAPGKDTITPVDKNPLDLRQAFIAVSGQVWDGTYKIRVGRQEMGFDLQRFVSTRDGPNVRQAFDAIWGAYELGPWRFITFASHPVQYRDDGTFNDYSDSHLQYGGVRIEREGVGPGDLSAYVSRYDRDDAKFLDASGDERRNILDVRYAGNKSHIDWDIETMFQGGHVGDKTARAWALGARMGYTLAGVPWTPRLGLQVDAASGDSHPGDNRIGTFNPLFPNGFYFSLAGYTGYSNLIHVKPSITIKPVAALSLMAALGLQWRQTTQDAVYTQGSVPVPGTAGQGSSWTGAYAQLRADWAIARNISGAVELVHFQIGSAIRDAGGHNSDYAGVELKYGW